MQRLIAPGSKGYMPRPGIKDSMPAFSPAQLEWLDRRTKELTNRAHPANLLSNDAVIQSVMWSSGMQALVDEIKETMLVRARGGD